MAGSSLLPRLDSSRLLSECTMFMNDVKYLRNKGVHCNKQNAWHFPFHCNHFTVQYRDQQAGALVA